MLTISSGNPTGAKPRDFSSRLDEALLHLHYYFLEYSVYRSALILVVLFTIISTVMTDMMSSPLSHCLQNSLFLTRSHEQGYPPRISIQKPVKSDRIENIDHGTSLCRND